MTFWVTYSHVPFCCMGISDSNNLHLTSLDLSSDDSLCILRLVNVSIANHIYDFFNVLKTVRGRHLKGVIS